MARSLQRFLAEEVPCNCLHTGPQTSHRVSKSHRAWGYSIMTPDSRTASQVVLLVDDEPMIHLIVTRTLQREGWTVLNATDGEHAVEIIGRTGEPPQLVITDMRMPRMNGAELGQWIEARYPTVPILYISGFMDMLPQPTHGRSASLGKPFTPAMLLQAVRELCSGTAPAQQPSGGWVGYPPGTVGDTPSACA
jgi:CheY-like chemotaxis protein